MSVIVKPPTVIINPWKSITNEELAKHNDVDKGDAWTCIRGIVYDIAAYAAKHPGGIETIKRYAGRDATNTFNTIHAYVNPASILTGFQVGILKGHPDAPKGIVAKLKENGWCLGGRLKPPYTYFKQDSITGTYVVEFSYRSGIDDWAVGVQEKRFLHVHKSVENKKAWMSVYELPETLESDQICIHFRNNYKTMEITLRKPIPTSIWANQTHGLRNNGVFLPIADAQGKFDAFLIYKKCLTPNVLMFGIQVLPCSRIGIPLGFHVLLYHNGVSRPYTPVCFNLMDSSLVPRSKRAREKKQQEELAPTVLYFMIKIYAQGTFTRMLDAIPLDDGREIVTLQVSTGHGYFDPDCLENFSALFLVAGGTGISPMIKILQRFWLLNDKLRGKRIALWHFVQTEHDLIWRKQFTELEDATTWFHYFPVLTKFNPKLSHWTGLKGRVTPELLNTGAAEVGLDKKGIRKACVCGPPGFNQASVHALEGKVKPENVFVFSS